MLDVRTVDTLYSRSGVACVLERVVDPPTRSWQIRGQGKIRMILEATGMTCMLRRHDPVMNCIWSSQGGDLSETGHEV